MYVTIPLSPPHAFFLFFLNIFFFFFFFPYKVSHRGLISQNRLSKKEIVSKFIYEIMGEGEGKKGWLCLTVPASQRRLHYQLHVFFFRLRMHCGYCSYFLSLSFFFFSDVNHKMDCRTAWLGSTPPGTTIHCSFFFHGD